MDDFDDFKINDENLINKVVKIRNILSNIQNFIGEMYSETWNDDFVSRSYCTDLLNKITRENSKLKELIKGVDEY